jgi:hypothetical protein
MDINHGQYYLLLTRPHINGGLGNSSWQLISLWGVALGYPVLKDCGAPPTTCLSVFVEAPRTIFYQNNIRFCLEMTFPGNLSLPMIVLGAFEGRHTFKIDRSIG